MCLFHHFCLTSGKPLLILLQIREQKVIALIIDSTSTCLFSANYLHTTSIRTILHVFYIFNHGLHFLIFLLCVERFFLHLIFWSQTQFSTILILVFTFNGATSLVGATCFHVSALSVPELSLLAPIRKWNSPQHELSLQLSSSVAYLTVKDTRFSPPEDGKWQG